MTRDEALSACLARGVRTPGECAELVAAQSVGGVYCDGVVVLDASGRRCIPREVVERRDLASPLPVRSMPLEVEDYHVIEGMVATAAIVVAIGVFAWISRR